MRTWIKDPLAILADGAARGVVVEDSRIVERSAAGREPSAPVDAVFDASRHVVMPGLINTHHHFFQTLTRAHPQAINKELFPWLKALYPIWAGSISTASGWRAAGADGAAAVRLHHGGRPPLPLPQGAGERDRRPGRGGPARSASA